MGYVSALSAYATAFWKAGGASRKAARPWFDLEFDVSATEAADLARKGYTPDAVAERLQRAEKNGRYQDQRDTEQAISDMLYGPDVDQP